MAKIRESDVSLAIATEPEFFCKTLGANRWQAGRAYGIRVGISMFHSIPANFYHGDRYMFYSTLLGKLLYKMQLVNCSLSTLFLWAHPPKSGSPTHSIWSQLENLTTSHLALHCCRARISVSCFIQAKLPGFQFHAPTKQSCQARTPCNFISLWQSTEDSHTS